MSERDIWEKVEELHKDVDGLASTITINAGIIIALLVVVLVKVA